MATTTSKPALEAIDPGFESSFKLRKYTRSQCGKPFWHFHPEYEIVYISNGRGKRHIGDHLSYYEDGDLIFLGPNLPHFGFTEEQQDEHIQVVLQMRENFLGEDFWNRPELWQIQALFERAATGISFSGATKHQVGRALLDMLEQRPLDRLIALLAVLRDLSESTEYELLNADGLALEVNTQDRARMQSVYELVETHFQRPIPLEEVASLASMTVPAFCRYFKRLTYKTFTEFVNDFRLAYARRLLAETDMTVAALSFEAGFNNLSHFNKLFKAATGLSPSAYRLHRKALIK
jgi:AraC-like DNA-binding protein/quercetin dioxygenase-like cupin family protein